MKTETMIYLVSVPARATNPRKWGNEKFVRIAELEGNVYSVAGFCEAFNNEEINADNYFIRILNVSETGELTAPLTIEQQIIKSKLASL